MFLNRRSVAGRRLLVFAAAPLDRNPQNADCEVLAALPAQDLDALIVALKSRGALGGCVTGGPPHANVASCRLFLWPDLVGATDLRPLPECAAGLCCNPYHWSRLCKPESPPPPYCRFAMDDKLKPEDRAPSEDSRRTDHERLQPESLTTDGEEKLRAGGREWCRLAYWELAARVGRQFPVEIPSVNVFSASPHGHGLCLDTLAKGASNHHNQHHQLSGATTYCTGYTSPNQSSVNVEKTRAKIGLGVTLSKESDDVWVYNRSEQPIFVNSPTLDDTETRSLLVYRVPPGHCLCIFDRSRAGCIRPSPSSVPTGPIDPNSVRISFAKGWGPKYSRQDVTACPCWLEVLLAPCR